MANLADLQLELFFYINFSEVIAISQKLAKKYLTKTD